MIHPGALPEPFPDEHFLGLLGRHARELGYRSLRQFRWGWPFQELPNQRNHQLPVLRRLFSGISSTQCGPMVETLLLRHSRVGVFDLFLPASTARRHLAKYLVSWTPAGKPGATHPFVDIHQSTGTVCLPFCVRCMADDVATIGEAYCHTLHDLPGVTVCAIHDRPLDLIWAPAILAPMIRPTEAPPVPAMIRTLWRAREGGHEFAVRFAQAASHLHAIAGTGYLGEALATEYRLFADELLCGMRLPHGERTERAQIALGLLDRPHMRDVATNHVRRARHVIKSIVRDTVAGGVAFAARMIARAAHDPASQMTMAAFGLIDITTIVANHRRVRASAMGIRICGFARCRQFAPDYRERFDRLGGIARLELSGGCVCGFRIKVSAGSRHVVVSYDGLAREMLWELRRSGISDTPTLARLLGLAEHEAQALVDSDGPDARRERLPSGRHSSRGVELSDPNTMDVMP